MNIIFFTDGKKKAVTLDFRRSFLRTNQYTSLLHVFYVFYICLYFPYSFFLLMFDSTKVLQSIVNFFAVTSHHFMEPLAPSVSDFS